MGKVTFGALVTDITGSIGGLTFQTNRSGNIVRLRPGPRRTSTTKQTISHQKHIEFLQLFQQLTGANKTDWNDFALANTKTDRFGQVRTLTGQNWFESVNQNRELVGESILNSPPVHILPAAVQDYALTVDQSKIEIAFSPSFNPTDGALLVMTTYPTTRTTTSFRTAIRTTKVIPSGPFVTIDLTSDWESTHSIPYPPSTIANCIDIGVSVQVIRKSSGIQSTALFKTSGTLLSALGIGEMAIGTTFVVS